uniref:Uncharacterized protein n=1 Tax=Arundo donax TaxID=35708 RepID=A0A0A9B4X8_ARUDO
MTSRENFSIESS